MDIPEDFDSKWDLSDIVLIAEDAEGNERELHANKAYLATFSSVFKTMFFSSFIEANSESVKVSCDYETMKLILQILYGLRNDFSTYNRSLEIGVLAKLYKATDYFDFPAIRKMCIEQMKERRSLEMATAILGVASIGDGLHDTLMDILTMLSPDDKKKFLSVKDSQLLFSKKDVKCFYHWMAKKELSQPNDVYRTWTINRKIPDLSEKFKKDGIDSTQQWPRSDIIIITKNSDGKKLYSNQTVLSMVSSHFANLFFGSPDSIHTEIEVDVDYMIMKNILAIIHQSFDICNLSMPLFLIYNMYCIASRGNLDIPMVRRICVKMLMDCAEEFVWELATFMKLEVDERLSILNVMDTTEIWRWLFDSSETVTPEYFSTENDKKFTIHFTGEEKPIVSTTEVGIMIKRLLAEYNK